MFSKLTFITSARCANSSTECGERTNPVATEIRKRNAM